MKRLIVGSIIALALPVGVQAADLYGTVNVGTTRTKGSGSTGSWTPDNTSFSNFAASAAVGLRASKNFAVELGYADFGKASAQGNGLQGDGVVAVPEHVQASGRIAGVTAAVVISGSGDVSPHLRLGAFYDVDKGKSVHISPAGHNYTTSGSNVAPMLGVGVSFAKHFTVDYTLIHQTNAWDGMDLNTQAITVGYVF